MNLVGNLIETGKNCKENISNKKKERSIGKSLVSPSNVQTTSGTQNSNHKNNTTSSIIDTDRIISKPISNYNNSIVNNKKKEYLELIKLLSSNNDSHNRNKKVHDQKLHLSLVEYLCNLELKLYLFFFTLHFEVQYLSYF